jgi:NADH-quinone oxidoreductase subunit A
MHGGALPILLLFVCVLAVGCVLLATGRVLSPGRSGRVKRMPYESGMDPVHDTRRRFDVRFHLLAIAFLVFDVELLFLYPWAVVVGAKAAAPVAQPQGVATASAAPVTLSEGAAARGTWPESVFLGGIVFMGLLGLGFVYDWKKGVFRWR